MGEPTNPGQTLDHRIAALQAELDELIRQRMAWHAELLEVARVYRAHVKEKRVIKVVQMELGYPSRGTAARRVRQARTAGYLLLTTKGKKGG